MNFLFPIVFSLVAFFSQDAFAIHAYRSENCKSANHSLIYKGNYPVGGMYGISLLTATEEDDETSALPLDDGSYNSTLEDADFIFSEISSIITEQKEPVSECYFDHEEWKSEKVIEVNLISESASKKLGLKKGDKIVFTCEEDADYPNGKECEEDK